LDISPCSYDTVADVVLDGCKALLPGFGHVTFEMMSNDVAVNAGKQVVALFFYKAISHSK
jgi:hypothetical protein